MSIRFKKAIYQHQNEGISYHYDTELEPNTCYVLRGESGIGKSTFFDVLAGYFPLQSGEVFLGNQSLNDKSVAERPINYLFQNDNLFEHLSAFDNAALAINKRLRLSSEENERVNAMLARCGVLKIAHKYPTHLSGGQRQRVALCRAFLRERPLLLLDEPFNGLDKENSAIVLDLALQHLAKPNHYLLISSHSLEPFDSIPTTLLGMEIDGNSIRLTEAKGSIE